MTNTNNATRTHRRLKPGTLVVSTADGEPGRIIGPCERRRCGDAWSYVVQTADGREVWDVSEIFLPTNH